MIDAYQWVKTYWLDVITDVLTLSKKCIWILIKDWFRYYLYPNWVSHIDELVLYISWGANDYCAIRFFTPRHLVTM